jgi:hypothetical protein
MGNNNFKPALSYDTLKWVEDGCDPTDKRAPSARALKELELDKLVVTLTTPGKPMKWLLTSRGYYELARIGSSWA